MMLSQFVQVKTVQVNHAEKMHQQDIDNQERGMQITRLQHQMQALQEIQLPDVLAVDPMAFEDLENRMATVEHQLAQQQAVPDASSSSDDDDSGGDSDGVAGVPGIVEDESSSDDGSMLDD
jgi:hypothetical protein